MSEVNIPIGTILPFYGAESQVPTGFLLCNGKVVSISKFPLLYEHLVFANPKLMVDNKLVELPDLRGEFLRGLDNGRNIDKERELGSYQNDQAQVSKHSHGLSQGIGRSGGWAGGWGGAAGCKAVNSPGDANLEVTETQNEAETRPRNIAINYIIRAD